jgi:hypothetical protein
MANLRPQLPAVPKTADTQTRLFLNAVANILRELTRPNAQTTTSTQGITSTGTQSVAGLSKASLGLGNVDNTADKDKPVSTPTQNALNQKLDKQEFTNYQDNLNFVGQWDVAGQSLDDIGAESGNTYEITGAGSYAGEVLKEGDYVKFFINEDDELDIIVFINGNYKADKAITMTAGNGLTGGGDLSANRSIALATPGTTSSTSANAVTADGHTHALDDTGVVPGTYTKFVTDSKGRVSFGSNLVAADIPNLSWSKITTGKPTTLSGYGITDAVNTSALGAVNGVATLGVDGKVPTAQLPAITSGTTVPTLLSTTFNIPDNSQVLFAEEIEFDATGEIVIGENSVLIEVS